MSFSNNKNKVPRVIQFESPDTDERGLSSTSNEPIALPVKGQGVFLFQPKINDLWLSWVNKDGDEGLRFDFDAMGRIQLWDISTGVVLMTSNEGFLPADTAFYWISLDSYHLTVRYGIGEARLETQKLEYQFMPRNEEEKAAYRSYLEGLETITFGPNPSAITPLRLLRDPIVLPAPLKVKGTDDVTMEDIAQNTYLPKANLSPIGQKLYDNVSGKNFLLDTPDFPDFSKAIEYSIATKGCWCYEKLIEKSTEFGESNPLETYLRITLGANSGESPGVPYVMEIWPVGHYSPVHNHAGANAIIRVLYGEITVHLFPFLNHSTAFATATFSTGDITWISPVLNQIHQLKNLETNTKTCITIQCYMYDIEDKVHNGYFKYVNDHGEEHDFDPDSDMDFVAFKQTIRKEWEAHLKQT
jgi:hypothetical protein